MHEHRCERVFQEATLSALEGWVTGTVISMTHDQQEEIEHGIDNSHSSRHFV